MEYEKRAISGGYNPITHSSRMYDALWALAFALNRTMTMVDSGDINGTGCQNASGSLVHLHEFDYRNEMLGCLIQWSLHQTNFSGLTVCLCECFDFAGLVAKTLGSCDVQ